MSIWPFIISDLLGHLPSILFSSIQIFPFRPLCPFTLAPSLRHWLCYEPTASSSRDPISIIYSNLLLLLPPYKSRGRCACPGHSRRGSGQSLRAHVIAGPPRPPLAFSFLLLLICRRRSRSVGPAPPSLCSARLFRRCLLDPALIPGNRPAAILMAVPGTRCYRGSSVGQGVYFCCGMFMEVLFGAVLWLGGGFWAVCSIKSCKCSRRTSFIARETLGANETTFKKYEFSKMFFCRWQPLSVDINVR